MTQISFWVPALPETALSPNGGKRSRRNTWSLSEAKLTLGDVAFHAALAAFGPDMPSLVPPVVISATLFAKHNSKNGDGLYRPTDPSNIGGDVMKPVIDSGLVKTKIIPDDSYKYVNAVVLMVRHVNTHEEEGILVSVTEVDADGVPAVAGAITPA